MSGSNPVSAVLRSVERVPIVEHHTPHSIIAAEMAMEPSPVRAVTPAPVVLVASPAVERKKERNPVPAAPTDRVMRGRVHENWKDATTFSKGSFGKTNSVWTRPSGVGAQYHCESHHDEGCSGWIISRPVEGSHRQGSEEHHRRPRLHRAYCLEQVIGRAAPSIEAQLFIFSHQAQGRRRVRQGQGTLGLRSGKLRHHCG